MAIQPEPLLPASNSILDDLISFEAENNENSDDRFMWIPSKMLRARARPRFTADTIPDTKVMFLDVNVLDKECIICGLNELNTLDMIEHWDEDHGLAMKATVEEWNATLEEYDETDNEPEFTPSTHSPGQENPPPRRLATLQCHRLCPQPSRRTCAHSGRTLRTNSMFSDEKYWDKTKMGHHLV